MTNTKRALAAVPSKPARRRPRRVAKKNRPAWILAAAMAGMICGGVVPLLTWAVAHQQAPATPMLWLAVAGGLAYSAPSVAEWFAAFVGPYKAWGFVLSLEVGLTFTVGWTSVLALAVLVSLNAFILASRFRVARTVCA